METDLFITFLEALAIGLLLGSERYKGKETGETQSAGMRTFAIIAVLGAFGALFENPWFAGLTFTAVSAFLILGYYKDPSGSYGLTTEFAALLTFWLGYMMKDYQVLAIGIGIIVVILLASKKAMHEFVKENVTADEFFDTLKFLAVVFVVYPLLPDRYLGPWDFFNPTQVWTLVILISAISYSGYILIRIYGGRRGLAISAILGGIVSTTAVTVSLAERSQQEGGSSRFCGTSVVLANVVQAPRLLFLIWFVNENFGQYLVIPFAAIMLAGLLVGGFGIFRSKCSPDPLAPTLKNPFSLMPILKITSFFVLVFFISKMAGAWFGKEGVYLASGLAGMGSVSAIALSLADMVKQNTLTLDHASIALLLALIANALVKWGIAWVKGSRSFALWLGIGFLLMLSAGGGLILWYAAF